MYYERKGSILLNVRGLRGIIKGAETAPGVPYDSPTNPRNQREGTAEVRRPVCNKRLGGAGGKRERERKGRDPRSWETYVYQETRGSRKTPLYHLFTLFIH